MEEIIKAHQPSRCLPQHGPIFFGSNWSGGANRQMIDLAARAQLIPFGMASFQTAGNTPLLARCHTACLALWQNKGPQVRMFPAFVYAIFGNQTTHSQASKIRILCWEAISCGWCDVSLKKVKNCQIPWNSSSLGFHKIPSGIRGCLFFCADDFFLHRLQLQEISYNSDLLSLPGNSPASKQHVEGQDLTWSDTTRIQIHTYKIVLKHKDQHHVFISPLLLEKCRECVLVPIVL